MENRLRRRLLAGERLAGAWQNLPGAAAAEIVGGAGLDWVMVDGEHGPWDPGDIRDRLIALDAAGADAVLRVPANVEWILKQALDLGARTVLVPMVDDAAAARAAVAACRYPPEGRRGMGAALARASRAGRIADYASRANHEVSVWVQAESGAALDALEAICAVEGVDCVFVGPADLGADLGLAPDDPALIAAIEDALRRIAAAGVAPGIFCAPELIARCEAAGARVVTLGSDVALLRAGLDGLR
jgi:4-hydroxy-2-oxoheptanedioate aldolase